MLSYETHFSFYKRVQTCITIPTPYIHRHIIKIRVWAYGLNTVYEELKSTESNFWKLYFWHIFVKCATIAVLIFIRDLNLKMPKILDCIGLQPNRIIIIIIVVCIKTVWAKCQNVRLGYVVLFPLHNNIYTCLNPSTVDTRLVALTMTVQTVHKNVGTLVNGF